MLPRHPSQLYEAVLEGIILFIILNQPSFSKTNIKLERAQLFFLIFYGILRIISEFFREPDPQIGYLFNLFSIRYNIKCFYVFVGLITFKFFEEK